MTDRRRLWSNGTVAHRSLEGQVQADRYSDGERARICAVITDLCASPSGARDRQLLRGETFVGLDAQGGWVFGYAQKDGHAGWIDPSDTVGAPTQDLTHHVHVARSYGKSTPGLKETGRITALPMGAQLSVVDQTEGWSQVVWSRGLVHKDIFVPSVHLSPLDHQAGDPVSVAERLLGTPYLWGGNSAFGIDCSGLVQAGCLACGIPCPGDSDMQQTELGHDIPEDTPLQRGDLLFWKGHVAWVADPDTLIHANSFRMATTFEPLQDTIKRIEAQGDGPVTARKRLGEIT
ncbi:MAG: NlpC/P60 family protein [Roseovarius sp.]